MTTFMKKPQSIQALIILSLVAAWSPNAKGGVILQPTASSTDMGAIFPASNAVNQSGLSLGYTTLVDDFDTYISSSPTANHGFGGNIFGSAGGFRSGNFDLDLGDTYLVSSMAFWNMFSDESGVQNFNILVDDNSSFSSPTNLGLFTASISNGSGSDAAVQVFSFAQTSASHVRLEILDTWSPSSFHTAFNEVAFEVSVIPEPSNYTLLFGAIASFAMFTRRRK